MNGFYARDFRRGRQQIFRERCSQRLTACIVDHLGEHGPTYPFRNAPSDLPIHNHSIDRATGIVNHRVVLDVKEASARVETDLRDMHGKAASEKLLGLVDEACFQRRLALEERSAWCDRTGNVPER